jgi:2-polyprenyl-3-methyl-5-hydroxy-6-metoxy-1,4-benzoquinol methylase
MSNTKAKHIGDNYVLPTGEQDAARLDLIHTVYAPVSIRGLESAGIASGMRVADMGCGTGTMTRLMARQVGAGGHVDGLDIAPAQIDVAKSVPADSHAAPINYHVGSAYEPGLDGESYDIVFCRLVLSHLKEPMRAVAAMAALLKPGGRLVLVEVDLRTPKTIPASRHYETFVNTIIPRHAEQNGLDKAIGLRLPVMMREAGLVATDFFSDQPLYRDGPRKHLWEITWRNWGPRLLAEGTISQSELDGLLMGMAAHTANPDVWVAVTQMFAAVGRK